MIGKKRCKILKEIRQRIADANDIEFITSECQHKGDCLGTCPKCEAELRYLERELEKRQRLGKVVVVAGLSAVIATSTMGCDDWFGFETGGDPLPDPNWQEQGMNGGIEAPPESELGGVVPLPPDQVELGGDPLPDPSVALGDIDPSLSADDLKNILLYGGVTREGLYNSYGWAERLISTDESGTDVFLCPIEGYETMTIIYQHEDDSKDFIVDVQFHSSTATGSGAVILPTDDFS